MRIQGLPTRKVQYLLYDKSCDEAIDIDVGFEWAGEFIFLSIVTGANNYVLLSNKVYVNPVEAPVYNILINQGISDY